MKYLIGGLLVPYFPALVEAEDSGTVQEIAAQLSRAAVLLKQCSPQTVVLLTPNGAVIEDAVGLYVQPRLKGVLRKAQLPEIILGFETDHLLMQLIAKQSQRLGVHVEQLTDDVLAERSLSAQLGAEALTALYYLQRAGFKGQVVNLSYGALPYEELYTLGKAVRLAVEQSGRSAAVVAVAVPPFSAGACGDDNGRANDERLLAAVGALDVKALLAMDSCGLDAAGEQQLRPFFFLLGALVGSVFADQSLCFQEVDGRVQAVGRFLAV